MTTRANDATKIIKLVKKLEEISPNLIVHLSYNLDGNDLPVTLIPIGTKEEVSLTMIASTINDIAHQNGRNPIKYIKDLERCFKEWQKHDK